MGYKSFSSAIYDFRRARNRAAVREAIAWLTRQRKPLMSYEEVRRKLKGEQQTDQGLKDIPLDAIVGSVNRYEDFTRDFLPLANVDPDRWARIEVAVHGPVGLDPIEVYQVGEVYFVKDGNHRVSVARELGSTHIQAYITEIHTRVPLTSDIDPETLILKAEYSGFLERTRIDEMLLDANLSLTAPGQYHVLEEHIRVHQYFLGIEHNRPVLWEEAVRSWYERVYQPITDIIWNTGILKHFPGRTEADLYLWIAEHRAQLEKTIGREIRPEHAAGDLAANFSSKPGRAAGRLGGRILRKIIPDSLETGPVPGEWRRTKANDGDSLFRDILVPLSGRDESWSSLELAIEFARRENAHLYGLHVSVDGLREKVERIEAEFHQRCSEKDFPGHFMSATGEVSQTICDHARWSDLLVVHLGFPPSPKPIQSMSSSWRKLVQRCPRPILAVPNFTLPDKALLAYDGSPKSEEALYVATYLAGKWKIKLVVLTVSESGFSAQATYDRALLYLQEHQVQAEGMLRDGPVPEMIIETAEEKGCELLLMGGYGSNPVLEVVLGSSVDQVLRSSTKPVLFCR
jgi:nucleotide-binding universal stress UspA family protein